MSDYDAVIIGSGAGGGTLARYLGERGKKVLVIERGGWVPREPYNWDAYQVFEKGRYVSPDQWGLNGKTGQPQVHYNVGGATKFYGAALYRLREDDFKQTSRYGGESPAWPIGYGDLDLLYDTAERWYHVHGGAGDPTEPPRAGYPYPAVRHEPAIQRIADSFAAGGLHPSPAPCGVMLDEDNPLRSRCVKCAACDGFPCPLLAKADAETCGIRPAIDTGNVELWTNATVYRLNVYDGEVRQIWGTQDGKDFALDVHGIPVVLAAGAVNSAAIWLRSGIPDFSGQAGRNYMCHISQAVLAVGEHELPRGFHKTLAVNDFYWAGGPARWPLGSIQMAGQPQAAMLRGESWAAKFAPGTVLRDIARRAVVFWLMTEDLPRGDNRVTVDGDGRIKLDVQQQGGQAAKLLYRELVTRLPAAGFGVHARKGMGLDATAHQCGTLRMSAEQAGGVVNADGRAWSVGNLYAGDASVFPSSGAVNPALTVMAWALRLGRHLTGRL